MVYSDDKEYEKKDRNLNEPLQFYSGKEPMLFEIVVNSVSAQELSNRLPVNAQESRRLRLLLNNRGVGREHQAGLVAECKTEAQVLARVPLLLGHPEG